MAKHDKTTHNHQPKHQHRRLRIITIQPKRRSSKSLPTIRTTTKQNTARTKHGANQVTEIVDDLYELPKNWIWTLSSDVCSSVRDGTHETPKYVEKGFPLVTSKNLKPNGIDFSTTQNIGLEDHKKISVRSGVEKGDVLFAMIGTIGNPVVVKTSTSFSIKNVALFKKNESIIEPNYLQYWLSSDNFNKLIEKRRLLKGTTQRFIPLGNLRSLPVPLAPINEQRRILAKVGELFSFLDAGVASLRMVQAQLKRYRQSVLKAAFEGKLTEQWQKSKKDNDVSATELLEKLYEEKTPKERKTVSQFPETDFQLNDLPSGWVWTTLENLTAPGRPIRYGIIKPGSDSVGGVPYVRVKEMKTGQIDLASLRRCNKDRAKKFAAATLKAGDILISKDGTIGKVAIVPPELEGGNITQHVLRLSPSNFIHGKFLARFIESPQCQRRIVRETRGVALQGINVDDFRKLPVPLPPLLEQAKIVEEIDIFSSNTDTVERSVETGFMLSKNLKMVILKNAFEGKLVPQDPSDEPAAKLLARIKTQRLTNKSKNSTLELSKYVK
jgi:type I restriction enzyme S subunit